MSRQIEEFLQQLGYSETDSNVFIVVYKYGPKPVSTIASLSKLDRTYCYKLLSRFVNDGIIHETIKKGVKHFFVPNPEVLLQLVEKKQKEVNILNKQFEDVKQKLIGLGGNTSPFVPKITIFEGENVVDRFYDDILQTIENNRYISISFFASNTFDSQATLIQAFKDRYCDFVDSLEKKSIIINGHVGEGILVMDSLERIDSYDEIKKILPGRNSTYGYIVGSCLYVLQFREVEIGLKIDSLSMADIFGFLLNNLKD